MIDPKRPDRYIRIYDQLSQLVPGKSPNLTAAMATTCALLHHKMPHHFWTGFYIVADDNQLHVGPYQGPLACQILQGQGVCLHAVRTSRPIIVPDVERFAGHIACDPRSRSEIAVPLIKGSTPVAVLDIDSAELEQFDTDDVAPLQRILGLLQPYL
ncbi:MAG: GAF domain-containing protein [Chloroflexota bacterium]